MNCNGISYCNLGDNPIVIINNSETFNVANAPICVEVANNSSTKKCWRFWGTSNNSVTFEHFACGDNAYYQSDASLINNGAWLVVDGVIQNGKGYFYWSGTFNGINYQRNLQQVTTVQRQFSNSNSSGDCNCINASWELKIKDKDGNQIYQKLFNSNPDVKVNCNGCPPNHIKCSCKAYPGYCCISCNEIKGGVASLVSALKGVNRG